MNLLSSMVFFVLGLFLVVYFAERLVKGAVGTSAGFGVSTFVISVVFIGFDPENLAVGMLGAYQQRSGIAMGSILGAAMVAIALAFGLTALIVPMRFERVPRSILVMPVLATVLLGALAMDGLLSRFDGTILLAAFAVIVATIAWLSKRGVDIKPSGEVAETLQKKDRLSKWSSLGLLALSLIAIVVGSNLLVTSSTKIIQQFGLSETFFGMTVLAFLVSVEEIARELPAAIKGRPEISYGNVVGSILAFFCFNAGIIALVRPLPVETQVVYFYLPMVAVTVLVTTGIMLTGRVPRWGGAVLVLLYLVFVIGGYYTDMSPPEVPL